MRRLIFSALVFILLGCAVASLPVVVSLVGYWMEADSAYPLSYYLYEHVESHWYLLSFSEGTWISAVKELYTNVAGAMLVLTLINYLKWRHYR